MSGFKKYYQKPWADRLQVLQTEQLLTADQLANLKAVAVNPELGETMIENFITSYSLPEGLALNYMIDGKDYVVPMVTEEPSVIAASSNGAKLVKQAGGFKTNLTDRLMIGQVVLENVVAPTELAAKLKKDEEQLLQVANAAHPSIVKRGGGARFIRVRILAADLISLDLAVDVKQAMGANMLNTMLEAVADYVRTNYQQEILMSILSNYATSCLVTAHCQIPLALLATKQLAGKEVGQKIAQASRLAQLDVYRATTHNKGIMNGIDAVLIASGNDWRAVEAGVHAYAARDGQYRGLSEWQVVGDNLEGKLTLPLPVGFVGGSIGIVPLVKLNHQLLQLESAEELEKICVSVGLAQNLAALRALVTEGIQKGHMHLQLKSLAVSVGAKQAELAPLISALESAGVRDSNSAKRLLAELRRKED